MLCTCTSHVHVWLRMESVDAYIICTCSVTYWEGRCEVIEWREGGRERERERENEKERERGRERVGWERVKVMMVQFGDTK